MKVKVLFKYWEDIIPKGCRKPREVRFDDGEIEVEIKEVAPSEAPTALVRTDVDWDGKTLKGTAEYRWYDGMFWTDRHVAHDIREAYGEAPQTALVDVRRSCYYSTQCPGDSGHTGTKATHEARIQRWAESFILIDGQAWRSTSEPCYYVDNSTSMGTFVNLEHGMELSRRREAYFSLLEGAKAEAQAREENANHRPDMDPMPRARFEIRMPETIKINAEEKVKITVFAIRETSYGSKDYELLELTVEAPPDAIAKRQHLEIAKREMHEKFDGPYADIVFDENGSIGRTILGMRQKIERLTTDKLELMGKSPAQDSLPGIEF